MSIDGEQVEIIAPINSVADFTGQVMQKLARPLIGMAENERRADAAASYEHAIRAKREMAVRTGELTPVNDAERPLCRQYKSAS